MEMKPMNKYEFLSQLRAALSTLPKEEREAAMSYYEEFFSDAGEENEQAVMASLGTPEELARSIISENAKDDPEPSENGNGGASYSGFTPPPTPAQTARKWTGGQITLIVLLAVFSSPIWLGLLCGIFGIIVGLFGVIIGLVGGIGAAAIAFFIAGIVALFSEPVAGIFLMGIGLILGGLMPLAIYPLCKCIVKLIVTIVKGIGALFGKLTGRRETVQ